MTSSAAVSLAIAFALPFALCFYLARTGQARNAWWIPGSLVLVTVLFGLAGARLAADVPTVSGAAWALGTMSVPAILGGIAGILLGPRRE